ncbi:MAG: DUF748 domain-containing protein [Candidatus Omnitrophica bacterium]|jgi:hypothetical protein|nr:DUF748 domain-containing protein [Candidatus Omnitrophota bacterium]
MKRIIIVSVIVVVILGALGIYFLNSVILPSKIQSLIISNLEKQTNARVTLKSLKFNIFQGLVLKDLVISRQEQIIFSVREVNCSIFILPIFNKKIIIPGITLKSAHLFIERSPDNQLNIQGFLKAQTNQPETDQKFQFIVSKVSILKGSIVFQDNSLSVPFRKEIKDINLRLGLSLPQSVKFSLKAQMSSDTPAMIKASGVYNLAAQELSSQITINPISLKEMRAYSANFGMDLTGIVGISGQVNYKNGLISGRVKADLDNLGIFKNKISAQINGQLLSDFNYDLKTKNPQFKGSLDIAEASLDGIDSLGAIDNIHGKVLFDNTGLRSDQLEMEVLGISLSTALTLQNFNSPRLILNSKIDLSLLPAKLKQRFGSNPLSSASGTGALTLTIQQIAPGEPWLLKGSLSLLKASLGFNKDSLLVSQIKGMAEFTQDQLNILSSEFIFQGVNYKVSGVLKNFSSPVVKIVVLTDNLYLQSDFSLAGKKIKISALTGAYLNSEFSISGDIDHTDLNSPQVDLKGKFALRLEELPFILPQAKKQLEQLKPVGTVSASFNLIGNPLKIKTCQADLELSSSDLSLYGFHSTNFLLNYGQSAGIAEISLMHLALYEGTIDVAAKANLNSNNLPYWVSLLVQGVKFEKLKLDTNFKNKDLAGILRLESKVSGFSNDLAKLSGAGKVSITEGKLWELNLFQGLGKVLFARDFANIVFSEGACNFSIENKQLSTNNLILKSNIVNLSGPVKIGFDGGLDAALNVEIISELVPLSGTLKDITTAIAGQAGTFGVIKLSGTLREPKYKFRPALDNIIKGITDVFFGSN